MKKNFLALLLLISIFTAYSQNQSISKDSLENNIEETQLLIASKVQNFIYTYSGAMIHGKTLDVNSSDKIPYIAIDSLKVNLSDIKFLKLNDHFWANTNKVNKTNSFALRNYKGNLNIYTKVESNVQRQYITFFNSGNRLRTDYEEITIEQNYDYYNLGFGDLKPVSYKYLIDDIGHHEQSLALLKKSASYNNLKIGFLGVGIASVVVGAILNKDNTIIKSSSFILGAVSAWQSVRMRKKQEAKLVEAIKSY